MEWVLVDEPIVLGIDDLTAPSCTSVAPLLPLESGTRLADA
jgi:hypothetical protein